MRDDFTRVNNLYKEESQVVKALERMVDLQQEDGDLLDKYSKQDEHTIKVSLLILVDSIKLLYGLRKLIDNRCKILAVRVVIGVANVVFKYLRW